jgi:hypothetical protein
VHCERLGLLVDGGDPAALAGHELAARVGGEGDDEVADGVTVTVACHEVLAGEPAELLGPDAGQAVEVGDTGATPGEDQRVVPGRSIGGPRVDHRDERALALGLSTKALVCKLWRRWDSNPRPPACKAGALAN